MQFDAVRRLRKNVQREHSEVDGLASSMMLAPLLVLSVAAVVLSVPRSVPRTSALPSGRNLKYQDDSLQQRRVRAHDYSCIARGQVFVAPSWLDDELLRIGS